MSNQNSALKAKMLAYKTTPLIEKSLFLACETIKYCKWLNETHRQYDVTRQLLRSATSVGANINEAQFAVSKRDFMNKLNIALKECSETEFWLVILSEVDLEGANFEKVASLNSECLRMLIASRRTAQERDSLNCEIS